MKLVETQKSTFYTFFIAATALFGVSFLTSCNDTTAAKNNGNTVNSGVVQVLEISGDIRIKRAFSSSWRPIVVSTTLKKGDQVFSGANGTAHLEYLGIGASVSLGPYSHFVITDSPPAFTSYRRNFGAESGKNPAATSAAGSGGAGTIALKKVGSSSFRQPENVTAVSMTRDTDNIPIVSPVGKVQIHAKEFPTPLAIKLDSTWNKTPLWAFLWKSGDDIMPVWTGYSKGSFAAIPIPSSGNYTLQIITTDESRTTTPIQITAKKRSSLSTPVIPDTFSYRDPVTVVMQ